MNQTHFLPPHKLQIFRKEGALYLKMDGQKIRLAPPKRALPLSNPDGFIVLSDQDGNEIGVVQSLHDLDPDSRHKLGEELAQIYHITEILRVLDVEREPLSGQVRWRVEVEASGDEPSQGDEESLESDAKSGLFRLMRRARTDGNGVENETPRREITFFIAGAEDVQTGRYPHIFLTDTNGNRYEIPNSEALDLTSRRMAERFF